MTKTIALCVAAALAMLGCTKKNPTAVCTNGQCSDPHYPFCDVDGAVGGEPNSCLAVSCTPGSFVTCDQDKAVLCNGDGNNYAIMACPTGCSADTNGCKPCPPNTTSCSNGILDVCDANGVSHPQQCAAGCSDAPSPHCSYLEPKYVPAACDTPAVDPSFNVTSSGTFDPDLDANCTGGVISQSGAPPTCVVRYGTISVGANATLTIRNNLSANGPTVAFVADGDITIDGTLDVAAQGTLSGAGGGFAQSGGQGTQTAASGGAGGATAGAPGGTLTLNGGGGNGGAPATDPSSLSVLVGGAAAFQSANGSQIIGGGGGGGGVTLISCNGRVVVDGVISAGGGGGMGGATSLITDGNGGGAGGNVVLQGIDVTVTGSIFANGGAGGAGGGSGHAGSSGGDASLSDTIVASGGTNSSGGGAGGVGATNNTAPGSGFKPTGSGYAPGAGGGSVGWIQAYTPAGHDPQLTPAHISPPFRPNGTAQTR